MKKRIDIEQLMSLSDEQKEKLRELWVPQSWDRVLVVGGFPYYGHISEYEDAVSVNDNEWFETGQITNVDGDIFYRKEDILPLLTIGDMIEILPNYCIIEKKQSHEEETPVYRVINIESGIVRESTEFADILFETLKEVL